jgi:hypothetical protein
VFTAYLKEKLKTKKEKRQAAEKEAAKKNQNNAYPNMAYPSKDELRSEAEETKPEVYFVVYDESGAAIRRVDGAIDEGFQRATWDLRYPTASLHEHAEDGEDFPPAAATGPLVMPGAYSVRMFQKVDGVVAELGSAQNFKVLADGVGVSSEADRAALAEFQRKVTRLYRAVAGAVHTGEDVQAKLKEMREAMQDVPAAEKQLSAEADAIEKKDREILTALTGDTEMKKRNEPVKSSINDRLVAIMEGERFALAKPTQSHVDDYNIAAGEFGEALGKLHGLVEGDVSKLEKDMENAGAPWTQGRVPEWNEK